MIKTLLLTENEILILSSRFFQQCKDGYIKIISITIRSEVGKQSSEIDIFNI